MRRPFFFLLLAFVALVGAAGCSAAGSSEGAGQVVAESRVVVLGDSYTVDSADGAGYVPPVAEALDWVPLLEALDGTGYVAPGLTADPSPYRNRLDAVVADRPDLVLVQGSTNDVGAPATELAAAADQLYAALAARLPDARVVVLGPVGPPGVDPAGVAGVRDVLRQAAAAAGLTFIDPLAGGWLEPSEGLYADPVHPNEVGYRQLAIELVAALRAEGL